MDFNQNMGEAKNYILKMLIFGDSDTKYSVLNKNKSRFFVVNFYFDMKSL